MRYPSCRPLSFAPTVQMPADDRWRDFLAEHCPELESAVPGGGRPTGSLRGATIGSTTLSLLQASMQRIARRRAAPRQDDPKSFLLVICETGSIRFRQRHRDGELAAGNAVLLDVRDYYHLDFSDQARALSIKLPSHHLRARLPGIDQACAREKAANPMVAPIVRHFATSLLAGAPALVAGADKLEAECLAMVTMLYDPSPAAAGWREHLPTCDDAQIAALRGFIERELGRIGLDTASAAAAYGISQRQVHRLFERQGSTFGRELLAARLRRAKALLADPYNLRLTIGQVSHACGFASQAHFAERYRQAYGITPWVNRQRDRALSR